MKHTKKQVAVGFEQQPFFPAGFEPQTFVVSSRCVTSTLHAMSGWLIENLHRGEAELRTTCDTCHQLNDTQSHQKTTYEIFKCGKKQLPVLS